jgi:hypothetical protein
MIVDKLIFSKHLEKGEKIMYSVHAHWIKTVKPVLTVTFFGLVIPWGLYFMGFNSKMFFWVAVLWSVLAYLRFLYLMLDWYANVWLITSMSIIITEWHGFFSNTATRIGYEDIEGVAYEIKGFWGTVLRYGNITLKVMSGNNMFMADSANPKKSELAIAHCHSTYLKDRQMQDAGNLKLLLAQMAATYMKSKE